MQDIICELQDMKHLDLSLIHIFFSNRGFVFADSLGDGSLGGIVSNTSKNDSPFF